MSVPETETERRNEYGTIRCEGCGSLYSAAKTTDGELVPHGVESGTECATCGDEEFVRVILQTD